MARKSLLHMLAWLLPACIAHATTIDQISSNVNGMRQLTSANIVQQYPGAAPYYGPAVCQQTLAHVEAALQAFDPAYTCSCPDPKAPPVCSGPPHFATASTTCSPETPSGGTNPVPQDFATFQLGLTSVTTTSYLGTTSTYTSPDCTSTTMFSGTPPNISFTPSTQSCASLGFVASTANTGMCLVGPITQTGTTTTYTNNYGLVDCTSISSSMTTTSACQVFNGSCGAPAEGYQGTVYYTCPAIFGGGSTGTTTCAGTGVISNPPPSGYAGWSGPLMYSAGEVGGGPDYCMARFACTGQPQNTVPFEIMCEGSNGGDTGWHLGSILMPTGMSNYPNTPNGGVDSPTISVGPNWGCSGSYTGSMIPVTANVQCDGPVCQVSLLVASTGSCGQANQCGGPSWVTAGDGWVYPTCGCGQGYSASTGACVGHVQKISWLMYRNNYQPICPSGTSYKPALQLCTTN